MITCVSERSGTASSDVRDSAAIPNPTAMRTPTTVKMRWRAQAAIRRSIMVASPLLRGGTQLALRGHQEVARRHDHLPLAQAVENFVVPIRPRSKPHLARNEAPSADVYEDDVTLAGRQDRRLGHRQAFLPRRDKLHVHERAGSKTSIRISRRDPDIDGSRHAVECGIDEGDEPMTSDRIPVGIPYDRRHVLVDQRGILLRHACDHPDGVEPRDPEEHLPRLERAPLHDTFLGNHAGYRGA